MEAVRIRRRKIAVDDRAAIRSTRVSWAASGSAIILAASNAAINRTLSVVMTVSPTGKYSRTRRP